MCAALIPTVHRRKVALTIGNNNYDAGALESCVNDATDLSNKLKEIGFSVTPKVNLRSEQMHREIEKFAETIRPGDLVFFFFAGHGTQWEDQNYLLPCDHNLDKGSFELRNQATNAQGVLALLSNNNPFVIVFLLDCCRDYWTSSQARVRFIAGSSHRMPGSSHRTAGSSQRMPGSSYRTVDSSQGMARMAAPPNSLIGFACAPGEVADDESLNKRNGRFTSHILQHITTPGEEVIMLLVDVAHGVVAETHGRQRPFTTSSFYQRGIWLVPPKTLNPTPVQPDNQGGVTDVVSHVFQKVDFGGTPPTITGFKTYKTNIDSTAPFIPAFSWGQDTHGKQDAYNGRSWSTQYAHRAHSWTVFYLSVPINGADRIVGGRMQVSNDTSSAPFETLRYWGKQNGEECLISDGYCYTQQYGPSYQRTSFFLAPSAQAKDAPNIIGGRMQITNSDSTKPWITPSLWGNPSEHEVIITESTNWSEMYQEGYQYGSLYFDRPV